MHKAAANYKIKIVDLMVRCGAHINIQDRVSDYILFVIHM